MSALILLFAAFGTFPPVMTKHFAVMVRGVAEVSIHSLQSGAEPYDTCRGDDPAGEVVGIDGRPHSSSFSKTEIRLSRWPLRILYSSVLKLPIPGALQWFTRVEAVPIAVHYAEELVRSLTRGYLSVLHFVMLHTQSLSQTAVKFLAQACPGLFIVFWSILKPFSFEPAND